MKHRIKRMNETVSALGMGCWAIGGEWGFGDGPAGWYGVEDKESIQAIHAALDGGITLFDTAATYGLGHSEKVLGEALKGRREQAFIATKFAYPFDEEKRVHTGLSVAPESVRQECLDSLRRLQTDHIDLYQLHHQGVLGWDVDTMLEELEKLKAEGKIRSYGWSTDSVSEAAMFARMPNTSAIQYDSNLFKPRRDMLAFLEEQQLSGLNRGPLAMGLLSGKYTAQDQLPSTDVRSSGADWLKYFQEGVPNQMFLNMLDAVREILTSEGRSLVQGAIGYLWGLSTLTLPIPGIKTVKQAVENAAAMQFGPLSKEQVAEIDGVIATMSQPAG